MAITKRVRSTRTVVQTPDARIVRTRTVTVVRKTDAHRHHCHHHHAGGGKHVGKGAPSGLGLGEPPTAAGQGGAQVIEPPTGTPPAIEPQPAPSAPPASGNPTLSALMGDLTGILSQLTAAVDRLMAGGGSGLPVAPASQPQAQAA